MVANGCKNQPEMVARPKAVYVAIRRYLGMSNFGRPPANMPHTDASGSKHHVCAVRYRLSSPNAREWARSRPTRRHVPGIGTDASDGNATTGKPTARNGR